jgi:SPP1 family predicted phage head-tail adaptor
MDAGRLDRRISIERVSTAVNAYNEPTGAREEIANVAANVQPVSDGERMRAGETLAERKSRFTIRYSSDVADVDARDFIVYEGRLYDINGVKEIGRRKYLEITATARAETP